MIINFLELSTNRKRILHWQFYGIPGGFLQQFQKTEFYDWFPCDLIWFFSLHFFVPVSGTFLICYVVLFGPERRRRHWNCRPNLEDVDASFRHAPTGRRETDSKDPRRRRRRCETLTVTRPFDEIIKQLNEQLLRTLPRDHPQSSPKYPSGHESMNTSILDNPAVPKRSPSASVIQLVPRNWLPQWTISFRTVLEDQWVISLEISIYFQLYQSTIFDRVPCRLETWILTVCYDNLKGPNGSGPLVPIWCNL